MLYLYLDESGDLGFDFVNKKPSDYFTICVLAIKGHENDRALAKAVRAAARRKLYRAARGEIPELKGISASLEAKKFFYKKAAGVGFKIYAVTLNKRRAYDSLSEDKERVYNYIARQTLSHVNFHDAAVRVVITVDKSKSPQEIARFNDYVITQIKAVLDPLIPLDIFHMNSMESPNLQAADLFSWGVFRKYEKGDTVWFDVFKERIAEDSVFLP